MEKSLENSNLEESLGQYQRSLWERVRRSFHQLGKYNAAVRGGAPEPPVSAEGGSEDTGAAGHELQHSHAVIQLKALLYQQATKENEVSPSRRRKMSPSVKYEETNMPTAHNLVPIIYDQSQYIQHLEAEVKFCKEELSGMKNRIQVVVLDNERLQEELKARRPEEEMREQTLLDASGNTQNSWITRGEDSGVQEAVKKFSHGDADIMKTSSAGEAEKWKLELERLKLTYEQKCEILESQLRVLRKDLAECQKNCEDLKGRLKHKESVLAAQVSSRVGGLCVKCAQHEAVLSQTHSHVHMQTIERLTKKDLAECQKNCEDLKGRLKHKESVLAAQVSSRVGGLCVKCAQHEAVLSQTHSHVHMQTIERLTKERDDFMSALVSARSSLADVQQREAGAFEQALIQCEQLRGELERQAERLEKELAAQQEKRASDKELMKSELTKQREDMGSQMLALSQNIAHLEAQVEKATREKVSAVNQLEEIQNQLASREMEATKVCGEMRYQLNKIKMEKDEAEKEHREDRAKAKRDLDMKDQTVSEKRAAVSRSRVTGGSRAAIVLRSFSHDLTLCL
ncbi:Serologically defined colon cancer antigen 8 like protein [Myotis davidii]|uniref:Serologically defined colon cancer antigen 8 like protein n=1 Tax=Myotis davidii TaxID=225400 RepID=L5M9H5_MYODS|nr:Serologically defined colon cancer antigen 8 like protein [Myotis davidii]